MSSFNKKPSDIRFLSTPTADTPGTALILTFPDKRYIFGNVHEGFQRANLQTRNKLLKVSDVFITGKTEWNTTGGLIGAILVMADAVAAKLAARNEQAAQALNRKLQRQHQEQANSDSPVFRKPTKSGRVDSKPTLTIHGGPNIAHTLATARRFVFRTGMPVYVDELDISKRRNALDNEWNPDWSDENIQIWKMPVLPIDPDKMNIHYNPESPLKRRFSNYASEDQSVLKETIDISEQVGAMADSFVENQGTLESVISHMFDSPWRLDKLHEMPLNQVQLPAAIFIRNQTTKNIEPYEGPMPDETNHLPQINVLVRKPWPGALVDKLPPVNPSKVAMSYVIRNHAQRGKFQPEKAKALNVPEGTLWRNLATGISVKSADGQTVTPDMVLEKGREGNGIAVVDLPSTDYVHNLVNRPEWQVSKVMAGIAVIIWILGPGVGQNEELQKFLIDNNHLKHIVSSQDYCPNYLAFDSSAATTLRLHQIDPSRFPILVHNNVCSFPIDQFSEQNLNFKLIQAQRGLNVRLEPALAVQAEDVIPMLNTARVLEEIPQEVLELAHVAKENISSESAQQEMAIQNLPSPDAEIICLGTGSALPSRYRNVSATLLRVPGSGSYLLDCGEDTLGQLKRIYSPTELGEILRDLKLIWISHLHADHHLGTISVIKAWRDEVHGKSAIPLQRWGTSSRESLIDPAKLLLEEKRLFVLSSSNMLDYLREYSSIEDYGFSHLVPLSSSTYSSRSDFSLEWKNRAIGFDRKFGEISEALKTATGLTDLKFCYVRHCKYAQAVSLTFATGFKFSYSGDCRPSKTFAEIGEGSTVLLHEATFDDELKGDAKAKNHSTTSEAIGVGVAMGARRILLTHFSQRYQHLTTMSEIDNSDVKLEDDPGHDDAAEVLDDIENADIPLAVTLPDDISRETQINPSITHMTRPRDLKIGVAFDYMRVKVRDIMHLEKFTPALLKLYEESELDEKSELSECEKSHKKMPKTKR